MPKHEIVSREDKKQILEKFNVAKENLPKILASDPVAKKMNAKPGDVMRITRDSPTAGKAIYYRIVIE